MERLAYGILYRLGFTPWDGHPLPPRLRALATELARGRALDVGCGTGDVTIFLAQQGWQATGVDFVQRALDRARVKAEAARVDVRWVRGDVTRLRALGIGDGFSLIVDSGCLHGMSDVQRDGYAREVTAVAAPGAWLVIHAFLPQNKPPRGIDRAEIERRFAGAWELVSAGPAEVGAKEGTLHRYELRRSPT